MRSDTADDILRADSITVFGSRARHRVVVCGSHAGLLVGRIALGLGVAGLVANDAGGGKEDAGVAGLGLLEEHGVPAVAVGVRSARIGNGSDTYDRGVVSAVNGLARELGIGEGWSGSAAARAMVDQQTHTGALASSFSVEPTTQLLDDGPPPVVIMDSAGWITDEHQGAIVVTGSHGGTVGGKAVKAPVAGAVFNDAGIGLESAGIQRLTVLDSSRTPAFTVSNMSARIGDGMDTYRSGIISHVNQSAHDSGVEIGDMAKQGVEEIQKHLEKGTETQWRR